MNDHASKRDNSKVGQGASTSKAEAAANEGENSAVPPKTTDIISSAHKPAPTAEDQPKYQWPPPRDPNMDFKNKIRNPVQAIITALPLIMLAVGLYVYYRGESQQTHSAPIRAESVQMNGIFTGLSTTSGRHYLWIERDGVAKGLRIKEAQVALVEDLVRNAPIQLQVAPSVLGSTTYWAWRVEQSGQLFLDTHDELL